MNTLKTFLWILKMSMRELRSHFFSLLPLILTLGLGLGTALGIDTLSQQIKITLDAEAQSLLGGDLDVSLAREFPEALLAELKNLPEAQNQVKWWSTLSMANGSKTNAVLADIKVIPAHNWPLLPNIVATEPFSAVQNINSGIIVDSGIQDSSVLQIGREKFNIIGKIIEERNRDMGSFFAAAHVYMSETHAKEAGLLAFNTRFTSHVTFLAAPQYTVEKLTQSVTNVFEKHNVKGFRINTRESAARRIERPLNNVKMFLMIVSLGTALLAMAGAALGLTQYLSARKQDVAMLRVLGASPTTTSAIYLSVSVLSALLGCAAALGIAFAFIWSFIHSPFTQSISLFKNNTFDIPLFFKIASQSIPFVVTFLVALSWPQLWSLQSTSPQNILREQELPFSKKGKWSVAFCTLISLAAFLMPKLSGTAVLKSFAVMGIISPLILFFAASGLVFLIFKKIQNTVGLHFRLATSIWLRVPFLSSFSLTVAVFSLFLILTVRLLSSNILAPLQDENAQGNKSNLFFIDVQPDQKLGLLTHLQQVFPGQDPQVAPLIRARLVLNEEKKKSLETINSASQNPNSEADSQGFKDREQNLSYGPIPGSDDTITSGRAWTLEDSDVEQFSVEEKFAQNINAKLGDTLTFDIQGIQITGKITSLRSVDWTSFKPNFFLKGHPKLLADAPQIFMIAVHSNNEIQRIKLIQDVRNEWPNISSIDATKLIQQVQETLNTIIKIVEVLSLFTFICALLVQIIASLSTQQFRLKQNAILRALGISHAKLIFITFLEFSIISAIAICIATLGAMGLNIYLSQLLFKTVAMPNLWPVTTLIIFYFLITVTLGLLSVLKPLAQKPNVVLQNQGA